MAKRDVILMKNQEKGRKYVQYYLNIEILKYFAVKFFLPRTTRITRTI